MFTFMHKYRVAILSLMLLSLVGFGAWGAIQGLVGGEDANPVLGSFVIPGSGEVHEVTGAEWRPIALQVMRNSEGFKRALSLGDDDGQLLAWDFIVLAEAARAAGIVISDDEVVDTLRKSYNIPEEEELKLPDSVLDFQRQFMAAATFRSQFARPTGGGDWQQIYERFRRDNEEVKGRYVLFERPDPDSFDLDISDEGDRKKLQEWWDANPRLKSMKRIPEEVDLEVLWVRLQDKSVSEVDQEFREKWSALAGDYPVTEEEIQARWTKHGPVYEAMAVAEAEIRQKQLEAAQKAENKAAKEEGREPADLLKGDQPEHFDLVKERIRQEIVIGKIMQQAWIQAHDQDADMEGLAEKYNLKHAVVKELDQVKLQTHPDFGTPRASQLIFGGLSRKDLEVGKVARYVTETTGAFIEDIFDEPGSFLAVYRVVDHRQPRDPELADVIGWALEQWRKEQADKGLEKLAEDFRAAVDEKISSIIADKKAELEAERDRKVAEKIEKEGLSREKEEDKLQIQSIESIENRDLERQLNEEKGKHEAAVFAEVATARGLEVRDTGWITESSGGFPQFPEGLDPAEKHRRIWRHRGHLSKLAALEPGRMGPPDVDQAAGLALVTVLDEKREPTPEDMYRSPNQVQPIRNQLNPRPAPDSFRFETFKSPEWFSLSAPRTEEGIAAERKLDQEREARRRARQKAKADAARAAAAEEKRRADAEKAAEEPPEEGQPEDSPPAEGDPNQPESRPAVVPPGPDRVQPPPRDPKK